MNAEKETREVVINRCFGGFGLSRKAIMAYAAHKGIALYAYRGKRLSDQVFPYDFNSPEEACSYIHYATSPSVTNVEQLNQHYWSYTDIDRDDPALVAVVKELGDEANGEFAELTVVEIPADIEWEIDEYDGIEKVVEQHKSWP